ncbi:response regulator [Streptomyces polygonati]|uniref:Response regulator n=1 Tax=Streptomyces polygonati TaxID=1617087 RepID=A0ABV8HVW6_9ACTN
MGELRPLAEDLNDDCRQFAQALRTLFAGLEVSVRRYAARHYRDAGTVSRYLSGVRVPPWKFVADLFADLATDHGAPATPLTVDRVGELHRRAVRATIRPAHGVEILRRQLSEADRESRRATEREDRLGGALLDRQHRIADLEVRLDVLETRWAAERPRHEPLMTEPDSAEDLRAERQRLKDQVKTLEADLEEARLRVMLAESRCDVLERQLALVDEPLTALPPDGDDSGAAAVAVAPGRTPARILAVDDQRPNLLALGAVLAGLGHEVVTADSGEAALKVLLDSTGFAVILLDVQMPDMDGYETAIHIKRRARTRNIPIIFLTAMDRDPSHMFRGYTAGAVDYLVKPYDPWIIRAKVEAFVQLYLEARGTR